MGDHLALLVDRLLTESTLEAAIGGEKQMVDLHPETVAVEYCRGADGGGGGGGSASKVVECRICQEEDWDTSMEAPCACCGSLKYAHRKCIQRWCNEKGDTICEICLQQFRPGYTAPQQLFHYGSIPMNFRGNWEIARQDLDDARIITMVPTERDFMDSYEDYLPIRTRSSTLCCRTVAIIFMALLILRHTLPLMIGGNGEYSLALFSLLVLRTVGILFPILVVVRALASFHRRRRQQERRETYVFVRHRGGGRGGGGYGHQFCRTKLLATTAHTSQSTDLIKSMPFNFRSDRKFSCQKDHQENAKKTRRKRSMLT